MCKQHGVNEKAARIVLGCSSGDQQQGLIFKQADCQASARLDRTAAQA